MKRHGFTPEQTKSLRGRVKKGDSASFLRWYDDCAGILGTLYGKHELTHIGDKNPYFHTAKQFAVATADYPKIWTIRDPRAVWYSGKAKGKNYLDLYLANAKYFMPRMDNTLVIRFEDLIREPKSAIMKVYDFLGVAQDKSFLNHEPSEYDRRFRWNPNSTEDFDPTQLDKWKKEAVPKKVMKIPLVKKIMSTFGYERG